MRRVALICAGAAGSLGVLALIGWTTGLRALSGLHPSLLPMPPGAALGFTLLGAGTLLAAWGPRRRGPRNAALALAAVATFLYAARLAEFAFGPDSRIESVLLRSPGTFNGVRLGRMSTVGVISFLLLGIALFLVAGRTQPAGASVAGVLAAIATSVSAVILLGYLYGAPLLYEGPVLPVPFAAAVGFALLSVSLVAAAGPNQLLLRPFMGTSAQARLLRAFVPLVVLAVLAESTIELHTRLGLAINPALESALSAIVMSAIAAAIALRVTRGVGGTIDRDITERRLAEHDAEKERRRAQDYLDMAGTMMIAIDREQNVLVANNKACEVLECRPADIIGHNWFDTFLPEKDRDQVKGVFAELMATNTEPWEYVENHVATLTGKKRLIGWHNTVLAGDDGTIEATLSSGEDITERKKSENRIKLLNERLHKRAGELEVANRELELLVYSISHDVRGPLMTIDGFAQALALECSGSLSDAGARYVERIRVSASRIEDLVDDLLELSRANRQPVESEQLDLSRMVAEISDRLVASTPGRRVEFAIAGGLTATADRRLMMSALENLLGNAFKFTSKHETAHIEFGARKVGRTPVYYVADDGAGFDPKRASELFEAFGRLHEPSEFRGTGIGLTSVERVVRRHGGEVWAEGEVERGATFYFTLGARRPKSDITGQLQTVRDTSRSPASKHYAPGRPRK